jgi:hypothetical protein
MDVLENLKKNFPYDGILHHLVKNVQANDKDYKAHVALKKYLIDNDLVETDHEYFSAYTYYMYDLVDGNKVWYAPGTDVVHRMDRAPDGEILPAEIHADGKFYWRRDGTLDNSLRVKEGLELPAFIDTKDGTKMWYNWGRLHRNCKIRYNGVIYTLPAVITAEGNMEWHRYGRPHRADLDANGVALPAVIMTDGTKKWFHSGNECSMEKLTNFLRNHSCLSVKTDNFDNADMPPEFYEYPLLYIRAKNGHTMHEDIREKYVL